MSPPRSRSVSKSPLDAAVGIGRSLCREAHWDRAGRLCNWMGRSPAEATRIGGPITPTSTALGPDLYGGSAGIALFLGHLYAVTGDPDFQRTAVGAIARSIRQLDRPPPGTGSASPISFFTGHLGVAYTAHRVSIATGQDALDAQADLLLDRVAEATISPHSLDLLGGNAGAIPALLAMGGSRCRELATVLGEELCQASVPRAIGRAWEVEAASGPGVGSTPLTGLAHGVAGMGLALLELHAATGRPDFQETALAAFAYEDSLFDPDRGNWPDLRSLDTLDGENRPPSFAMAWCHGAPGIALSRLRAIALDPTRAAAHLIKARTAMATTLGAIETALSLPRADATLCHGLAGLAEIALIAGQMLDDVSYRDQAATLVRALIDHHAALGDWPSGVSSGGPNPSLMLGTAGIGYTFLRAHDPMGIAPILIFINHPPND